MRLPQPTNYEVTGEPLAVSRPPIKSVAIFLLALSLADCSVMTARGTSPALSIESHLGLDAAARCIVIGWNEKFKGHPPLEPQITHKIDITDPAKVYEVAPQQSLTVGAEVYYARVVLTPPGSRIELYTGGTGNLTSDLSPALQNCR